jgi:radical SAM protein with 4Fe4S-binding SPASM domain
MSHKIEPRGAWLTVNRVCNFRCKWCYAKKTGYEQEDSMELGLAKSILFFLKAVNIPNVLLLGGEPTLWPHLIEFNFLAKEIGVSSGIITNALRFGDDEFWGRYLKSPNSSAGVSIKAPNAEDLFSTAGVRNFEQLTLGIDRAIKHFNCGVEFTYSSLFRGKLLDLARFAIDRGAKSLKIDFCSPAFEGESIDSQCMIDPAELVSDVLRDYASLVEIMNGKLFFGFNMPLCLWPMDFIQTLIKNDQIQTVCHVLKRQGLIFDTDGKILICNGLFDYPVGKYGEDFDDETSFAKFLNQPEILSFYDRISAFPSVKCQTCEVYDQCGGGCPLKWAIYDPDQITTSLHRQNLTRATEGR